MSPHDVVSRCSALRAPRVRASPDSFGSPHAGLNTPSEPTIRSAHSKAGATWTHHWPPFGPHG
eukprot:scaffold55627_cov68-Phaeocystis_antarctica.AAC.2